MKPLQIKYKKLKQQRRKITAKNGFGLAFTEDHECIKIVNPVLIDTNKRLDSFCSGPADTSLVLQQYEEENSVEEEQRQEKE